MKYLSHYMENQQTAAFKKHGAFFAFSNQQLDEQKQPGIAYVSIGAGLIAPKDNANQLIADLDSIHLSAVAQDLAENGVKGIIHRELANHECQITGDYDIVISILADYGITAEQIKNEWREYMDICIENDYF